MTLMVLRSDATLGKSGCPSIKTRGTEILPVLVVMYPVVCASGPAEVLCR